MQFIKSNGVLDMRSSVMGARIGFFAVLGFLLPSASFAGEAENIEACVKSVSEYAGKSVDEFDVLYEGSFWGISSAKWPGISCDVSLGKVFNLSVDGHKFIVDGYAGSEAANLANKIENMTDEAIKTLRSRENLLQRRKNEALNRLQAPNVDIKEVESFILDGIDRAL